MEFKKVDLAKIYLHPFPEQTIAYFLNDGNTVTLLLSNRQLFRKKIAEKS
jgi:hypothetical protein